MIVDAPTPGGTAAAAPTSARSVPPLRTPSMSRSEPSSKQRDLDAGVGAVERGERVEQRRDGAAADHADDEPAADQPVHVVDRVPQRLGRGERGPGVVERRRAGRVSVAVRADGRSAARRARCSSWRTWALTPDWLMCTRSAARVKLASSATATKYSSCLSSITTDSSHQKNYLLDF